MGFNIVISESHPTERLPWTANLFVADNPTSVAVGWGSTPAAAITALTHDRISSALLNA